MKYKIPSWSLAFLACLLWSTAFVGVKYTLQFASPLFIAGIRFSIAGAILLPFAGRGFFKEFKKNYKIILLVALLQTFLVYFFYFLALDKIKASTGAALVGLGPLVGALLGHFYIPGDRLDLKKGLSFVLGIIGVTLVSLGSGKDGGLPGFDEILGIILFILNIFSGAISTLLVRKSSADIRSDVLTSSQLLIGGVGLFILSLIAYDDITFILPLRFYIALVWLVTISAVGFSLWYYLLARRRENLTSLNIWKFVMPVTGGILGWIVFPTDNPTLLTVSGMVVVAFSVAIFYKK